MRPIVTVEELVALRAGQTPVRVLDVRWTLAEPDGHPDYLVEHIPGAVWVDLERELSSHGPATAGRHPLPDSGVLGAAAQRWGIHPGDRVVVYDDFRGLGASRAWWLLRRAGLVDVRVLDGGLSAWRDAGLPLESGEVVPERGTVHLDEDAHELPAIGIDEAARWPDTGVLIDARAPERYRGESEPLDPAAGHIPGAVNLPIADLLEGARFADADRLREAFGEAGVGEGTAVAAYCGSGVTAAQIALAGELAGIPVAVYPGSWSQWSNTPGRPIATG